MAGQQDSKLIWHVLLVACKMSRVKGQNSSQQWCPDRSEFELFAQSQVLARSEALQHAAAARHVVSVLAAVPENPSVQQEL